MVNEIDAPALEDGARGADADLILASSVDRLFKRLSESEWELCVVSLSAEHVDDALLERLAGSSAAGALILTARGASLNAALLADRLGALALLREPLEAGGVADAFEALADEGPSVELSPLEEGQDGRTALIGESGEMAEVFGTIAKVARSTSTVLITGESGTGKEVVARTLHTQSDRSEGPFVAVNCAAIPEQLLESELFGHEKGAFTGAIAKRTGRFQRADGGTLFLDEIGDMSAVLQAKLLRVLEERAVERVGGREAEEIDVRVVAATNQSLSEAILDGRFREDLYYRLAVVELALPPLRERGDDVRRLALHFAALFAERHGREIRAITTKALSRIAEARWPGNIRELRNVMDRAVLLTSTDTIRTGALRIGAAAPRAASAAEVARPVGYPATASLAEVEAAHIAKVLASVGGHIGNAADTLGIHRNTLSRKIQEYGLDTPDHGRAP
ncbi:MAG: sigma-54 dependent transcriptional regulator [Gemmatimonadota bacterium]|nr:sigma-54 dependent transcriptional regulator [Gemmatimonadota bacterium]